MTVAPKSLVDLGDGISQKTRGGKNWHCIKYGMELWIHHSKTPLRTLYYAFLFGGC
jgi:hypothetical protein